MLALNGLSLASPSVPLLDGACLLGSWGSWRLSCPHCSSCWGQHNPPPPAPPCSLLMSLQFLDSSDRFLVNSVVRIGTRHLERERDFWSFWLIGVTGYTNPRSFTWPDAQGPYSNGSFPMCRLLHGNGEEKDVFDCDWAGCFPEGKVVSVMLVSKSVSGLSSICTQWLLRRCLSSPWLMNPDRSIFWFLPLFTSTYSTFLLTIWGLCEGTLA